MPLAQTASSSTQFGLASFHLPGVKLPTAPCAATSLYQATVEQAVLAEQVGLDIFGINEGFSTEVLSSDPFDLMNDIATRTEKILLTTSISNIDTTDLATRHSEFHEVIDTTNNRAEIVLNRDRFAKIGSGHTSAEKENEIFNERLAEWSDLIADCKVEATWIEVIGRSDAILQAARYSIPMLLQVNSGSPLEKKPFVDMYHTAISRFGRSDLPLGLVVPGFIAETDEMAEELAFEPWAINLGSQVPDHEKLARFEHEIANGALYTGGPESVAKKIAKTVEHLGLDRFIIRYTCGLHTDESARECIRLYGEEVVPRVRDILGRR